MFRIRALLSGSGRTFFLSPDQDRPKIRIRSGEILIRIHEEKKTITVSNVQVKIKLLAFLAPLTLSFLVRFLQNLIKENRLDPYSLFEQKLDGSG